MIERRVADFFQFWRERYQWPLYRSRLESEKQIHVFTENARAAIASGRVERLRSALMQIHRWKTRNQADITNKYARQLEKDPKRVRELHTLLPITIETPREVIIKLLNLLRFPYCNLPVCTAQVSFLSGRVFPILDRYVAQFFSQRVHPMILKWAEYDIKSVFETLGQIDFALEDDGRGKSVPRLAVFSDTSFRYNRNLYLDQFIPQLQRIVKQLQRSDITFKGINRSQHPFTMVDLQMAILIFAKRNTQYFRNFYRKSPIPSLSL